MMKALYKNDVFQRPCPSFDRRFGRNSAKMVRIHCTCSLTNISAGSQPGGGFIMAKTIIITGASAGIGRATAKTFLADGYKVGLIGRRDDALKDTAEAHENARCCHAMSPSQTMLRRRLIPHLQHGASLTCCLTMPDQCLFQNYR